MWMFEQISVGHRFDSGCWEFLGCVSRYLLASRNCGCVVCVRAPDPTSLALLLCQIYFGHKHKASTHRESVHRSKAFTVAVIRNIFLDRNSWHDIVKILHDKHVLVWSSGYDDSFTPSRSRVQSPLWVVFIQVEKLWIIINLMKICVTPSMMRFRVYDPFCTRPYVVSGSIAQW